MALVEFVKRWAVREQAVPAQIALAWLMAQGPSVVPIPGTTKMAHLLDNIGADAVHFTPTDLSEINAALLRTPVHGTRLLAGVLSLSGVEAPKKQG
ncbi:MAG: aldo/keto reductase [Terracidiphilus sp.]|nr:aldo/keto reductase [Terracidiphilus sp.]MDR3777328.1 aldo/keto reductase [Terracidiphilus sp.]